MITEADELRDTIERLADEAAMSRRELAAAKLIIDNLEGTLANCEASHRAAVEEVEKLRVIASAAIDLVQDIRKVMGLVKGESATAAIAALLERSP